MSDKGESEPLDEWILKSRLPFGLEGTLNDMGVDAVEDLSFVFDDVTLLDKIKGCLTPTEYTNFLASIADEISLREIVDANADIFSLFTTTPNTSFVDVPTATAVLTSLNPEAAMMTPITTTSETDDNSAIRQKIAEIDKAERRAKKAIEKLKKLDQNHLLVKTKASRAERELHIAKLFMDIALTASLDVAFALDCTGSMTPYITAMRDGIVNLVEEIKALHPDLAVRLSFIAYRDILDGPARLDVLPFTVDVEAFKLKVTSQRPHGGNVLTDTTGALNVAANDLDWQSDSRMFLHIGDMPCHGDKYHSLGRRDAHPAGDPNGLNPELLLSQLFQLKVQYVFFRITEHTDKMISVFNQSMLPLTPKYIETTETDNASSLMEKITMSVSATVSESLSTTASTSRTSTSSDAVSGKDFVFVKVEPDWDALPLESGNKFALKSPNVSYADTTDTSPVVEEISVPVDFHVGDTGAPYGKGGSRIVFKAHEFASISSSAKPAVTVHKVTMKTRSKDKSFAAYEKALASHYAASCLAVDFSSKLQQINPALPTIRYVNVAIVQNTSKESTPFCISEEYIEGDYVKFNGNNGYVSRSTKTVGVDVIHAFSHWTYCETAGDALVCDCQGAFDAASNSFSLTDPAIHCKDALKFGGTNLMTQGMRSFFQSHKCNDVCRSLGLAPREQCLKALEVTGTPSALKSSV